jgi:hypothetical protein
MLKLSAQRLSPKALQVRAISSILFAAPIVGAHYYGYTNQTSPLFCPFRTFTGIPCPGCGMTRSFCAIATGRLEDALNYHFFGIFLFVGFAIAVVHLLLEIINQRKITSFYTKLIFDTKNKIIFLVIFLTYYLVRLSLLYQSGVFTRDFLNSPLGRLLF